MAAKVINYVIATLLIWAVLLCLCADSVFTIGAGVVLTFVYYMSGKTTAGRKFWRKFWISNMQILSAFGLL